MTQYLTELKLIEFCISLWPNDQYITNKSIKGLGKFRPDYVNLDKKIVVEFDGYQHYTQAKIVESDKNKDKILIDAGYRVVRWPYFIQLETRTIYEYFGIHMEVEQTYPHGFISKECILPADFCIGGHLRFIKDVKKYKYAESVIKEIFNSIETQIKCKNNFREIWPNANEVLQVSRFFEVMSNTMGRFQNNYS